jgi:hypothetical protein
MCHAKREARACTGIKPHTGQNLQEILQRYILRPIRWFYYGRRSWICSTSQNEGGLMGCTLWFQVVWALDLISEKCLGTCHFLTSALKPDPIAYLRCNKWEQVVLILGFAQLWTLSVNKLDYVFVIRITFHGLSISTLNVRKGRFNMKQEKFVVPTVGTFCCSQPIPLESTWSKNLIRGQWATRGGLLELESRFDLKKYYTSSTG